MSNHYAKWLLEAQIEKPISTASVPTHFHVLLRLRTAIQDNYAPVKRVIDVLSGEPVIAAKVVQAANIAANNSQGKILDVERAVFRLGLGAIRRIVLAVIMQQLTISRETLMFASLSRGLWLNSLYTSAAAATITRDMGREVGIKPDEAAFYGLMTNLGGFYLLYQAARLEDLHDEPEIVQEVIVKNLPKHSREMAKFLELPAEIVEALDFDDLYGTTVEAPPSTIREILYAAQLMADHEFPWSGSPSQQAMVEQPYLDLKDNIDARFETVKAEYS